MSFIDINDTALNPEAVVEIVLKGIINLIRDIEISLICFCINMVARCFRLSAPDVRRLAY